MLEKVSYVRPYSRFALIYDIMMRGLDYRAIVDKIENIIHEYDYHPRKILDLACGTGNLAVLLAQKKYEIIAVDSSEQMLRVAKQKAEKSKVPGRILFVRQDMKDLALKDRVDTAICLFDSLNYLLKMEDLESAVKNVYDVLAPGGMFIFDVNSTNKAKKIREAATNMTRGRIGKYSYVWENEVKGNIWKIRLSFSTREKGKVRTFREIHKERLYGKDEIEGILRKCGFSILRVYNGFSFENYTDGSQRILFMARKLR